MSFWEQNKLFLIVSGVVFVAAVYLWPSVLGRWLAPWDGPVVARPDRSSYEKSQREIRQIEERFTSFYAPKGNAVPITNVIREATKCNEDLLKNFEEMHRWMSFVPRYPFRIPGCRTEKNSRQRYVSLAYTFARDGELICDEYGPVREPQRGVVFATSTRNIKLGDPYFGLRDMELPDAIADPDLAILQVALIHDIGQLAVRCGVDEIVSVAPRDPYTWQLKGKPIAKAFPIDATVKCNLSTLLKLLHALDGAHGRVAEILGAEDVPAKAAPRPAPKAAVPAAAQPDDEGGDEATPAGRAAREGAQHLVIRLTGEPTVFAPEASRAALPERFTIFRPAEDESHKLTFVANAVVTHDLGKGRVEAEVEPNSTLQFAEDGTSTRSSVRRGDYAATRFFLVRALKVKSDDGTLKLDKDGFPTEVTPPHLVVDLSVAGLQFLEIKMPEIAKKRQRVAAKPIHQGW
jgi:hypothetical protein